MKEKKKKIDTDQNTHNIFSSAHLFFWQIFHLPSSIFHAVFHHIRKPSRESSSFMATSDILRPTFFFPHLSSHSPPPYSSTRIYFVLLPLTFIPHFSPKQNFTRSLLSLQNVKCHWQTPWSMEPPAWPHLSLPYQTKLGYWSLMYLQTPRVAWQRNYCLAGLTCAPHTPHILLCHSRLLVQSSNTQSLNCFYCVWKKKKKFGSHRLKKA